MWSRRAAGSWLTLGALVAGVSCGRVEGEPDDELGASGATGAPLAGRGGAPSVPMTAASGGRPAPGTGMIPMPGTGGVGMIPMPGTGGEPGQPLGGAPSLPPGVSLEPQTVQCDVECESASLGLGPSNQYFIDPCCTSDGACGLNTGLLSAVGATPPTCEAKHQPGALDASCPDAGNLSIPAGSAAVTLDTLPGCCRASTGTCGVLVNQLSVGSGVISLGAPRWGCMDSAPFFNGAAAPACSAEGGAGGAPGQGFGGGAIEGGAGN